jgi:hypothetical protein
LDEKSLSATFLGLTVAAALWSAVLLQAPVFDAIVGIALTDEGLMVVADEDIVGYDAVTHEITLTDECAGRLKERGYLWGPFSLYVDGEEVLSGVFVPAIVSRSYPSSQVVITYPSFDQDYSVMKMQMGYPWDEPVSPDPRDDPRIATYFESTGRLAK